MNASEAGLKLIRDAEGLELTAYVDAVGAWTIGYGHTNRVKRGDTCTREQAEKWLLEDVAEAEEAIERLISADLNQNQFDALVSFTYNLGAHRLKNSTLRRLLNAEDYVGAANEFPKWNKGRDPKSGALVSLAGLTKRRAAERALFIKVA